jgi:hypothetical protein
MTPKIIEDFKFASECYSVALACDLAEKVGVIGFTPSKMGYNVDFFLQFLPRKKENSNFEDLQKRMRQF